MSDDDRVREAAKALIPRVRRAFQLSGVGDHHLVGHLVRCVYEGLGRFGTGVFSTLHKEGPVRGDDVFDALDALHTLIERMRAERCRPKWTEHERAKFMSAATAFDDVAERYLKRATLRRLQTPSSVPFSGFTKFSRPLLRPVRQGFSVP